MHAVVTVTVAVRTVVARAAATNSIPAKHHPRRRRRPINLPCEQAAIIPSPAPPTPRTKSLPGRRAGGNMRSRGGGQAEMWTGMEKKKEATVSGRSASSPRPAVPEAAPDEGCRQTSSQAGAPCPLRRRGVSFSRRQWWRRAARPAVPPLPPPPHALMTVSTRGRSRPGGGSPPRPPPSRYSSTSASRRLVAAGGAPAGGATTSARRSASSSLPYWRP